MIQHQKLKQYLVDHCLKFGEFKLSSGKISQYYLDAKQATLNSSSLRLISELIFEEILHHSVDAFGGPAIGADPVVGAVLSLAFEQDYPLTGFIVRGSKKSHGTEKLIEGPLLPGMRVILFDDVTTSGQSLKHAIDQVEAVGCAVVEALSIVDRYEGAGEHFEDWGYNFHPFFYIDSLIRLAAR